jgi:exodeoxyribonuclease VII small subunit
VSRKTTSPSDRPAKEQSFEDSLAQLETIIGRIEGGKVGLEGAIAEYERGVVLLRRLRDTLRKSEQRVEELNAELAALEKPGDDAGEGAGPGAEPGSW